VNHSGIRVASPTEQVNPRTAELDTVPTLELVRLLHEEDRTVPVAVAALLPELAALVDEAAARVDEGGRVHYFGAGTSGRLGVLDAAELLPTFGLPDGVVIAHQAGGTTAFRHAVEDAEDNDDGADAADVAAGDVVIGLAASGRTPYVRAALAAARTAGAASALITSNPNPPLAKLADYLLVADTGPEAITGSTRLKAGTAQKLILNTFSTALMVRLGHTYGNLMVDMRATNAKLRGRAVRLLGQATGAGDADCAAALDSCDDLKTALVYLLAGQASAGPVTPQRCRDALAKSGGRVRQALAALNAYPAFPPNRGGLKGVKTRP
jgi:N-acetylmuramic acid 6-phosphate etherase